MPFATEIVIEATPKIVVVVENNPSVRIPLVKNLKQHGFQASGASNRAEMIELVKELKQEIDVAVLDINLESKDSPATTGFDIGQEMVEAQPNLPPQRIVYSGHVDQKYYKAAVRMGADDYIAKATPHGEMIVVNRVRTSSLVRALSPVRSEISEKIEQIAEKDGDFITTIKNLCLQVIAPEVEMCLGVPAVFFLSDRNGTQLLTRDAGLSHEYNEAYTQIQNKTFEVDNNNDPLVFTVDGMAMPTDARASDILKKLEGGSFIPLYEENGLRLSLGILPAQKTDPLWAEKEPREFASSLRPKLREPIVNLFKYLSRIKATIDKAKLTYTSNFCLYVSKTQSNVLEESLERKEIESSNECFRKLKKLADDLHATGIEFSQLNERRGKTEIIAAPDQKVSVRDVVEQAWQMIKEQGRIDQLQLKQIGEELELRIARRDLLVAVLRMLQWLAQRADKIPPEATSRAIEVAYERQAGRVALRFTDHSRRLGEQLRKRLFEPFTQSTTTSGDTQDKGEQLPGLYLPLYLAKMLLTVKNNGLLEDKTEELKSDLGHCFIFSFPVEEEKNPAAATG
jgi:DNA-binding response OmpR family regulator/signal transduction histidine kinase